VSENHLNIKQGQIIDWSANYNDLHSSRYRYGFKIYNVDSDFRIIDLSDQNIDSH